MDSYLESVICGLSVSSQEWGVVADCSSCVVVPVVGGGSLLDEPAEVVLPVVFVDGVLCTDDLVIESSS